MLLSVAHRASQLGVADDLVPILGTRERGRAGGRVHLLVGPERPADVVLFQHGAEPGDPIVAVLAGLAHPERDLVALSEIEEWLMAAAVGSIQYL